MRPVASLLLATVVLAAPAEARRTQGGTIRVLREKRSPGWQLFLALNDGQERVQLYGDSRPAPGMPFAVIDTKGRVGEVRIDEVSVTGPCQGIVQARGAYAGDPRREFSDGVGVAIGPIDRPLPHARLYIRDKLRGTFPYGTTTLFAAIDLDGNEVLDVAAYVYDCQRGPGQSLTEFGQSEICVESFSRESSSAPWRQIRRTQLDRCF